VQKVGGANTPEEHAAGIKFFEQHAFSLAYLQFLTWMSLCNEHGSRSSPAGTTLQIDLARTIVSGAIFEDAPGQLVEYVRKYLTANDRPFVERYVQLA